MEKLGKLTKVELREYWSNEARHFTPWLAQEENLQELSDTIGIDIEIEGTEVFIGTFKADIVARDISNNERIIIENQLEKSNHDHLGKIITYASGIGASVIIWICASITDEHRQAINWLNENTTSSIYFFGLQIELWRIGDSPPAPKFNVVCRPNEWVKTTKESGIPKELSETKLLQLEYWNFLKEHFNRSSTHLRLRTPRAQHWYPISIGRSKFHLTLRVNTVQNRLGCEIYMRGENAKWAFSELMQDKENIEQELNVALQWQELPDGQDSRIVLYRNGNINDRSTWSESAEWFKQWAEAFYKTFSGRVKQL